jgi:hypothetical protein
MLSFMGGKIFKISAHADGGPRSGSVHARPSAQPPIDMSGARVCRVTFFKFPHFPVEIGLFRGVPDF